MRKLAAWCHDRRRTVIGLWVAAFILFAALMATASGEFVNNFNLPGTESQRTYDLLKERFPAQAGDTASVVFAVIRWDSIHWYSAIVPTVIYFIVAWYLLSSRSAQEFFDNRVA